MSETAKAVAQHMGTKFLGMFFGMVLAMIYTIRMFFDPTFDAIADIPKILFIWAVFIFVIPLLIYLAEIVWRYAHAYSEKFPVQQWTGLSNTMRAVYGI